MGTGTYSAQYLSEGHLQQKWEDPAQLAQYDPEVVVRMEGAGTPAPSSSQYVDQNMLGPSQTHQPSTNAYTSPHHQSQLSNPAPSPLMYPQSHLHYPQHSPSPSPYMEKCNPMPHCYKGYNMPPSSQYSRQMSSHGKLNQGSYRPTQNSYSYQQPPSRGYEQQPPLQALTNPQETHNKYQHYNQSQQNYCLSELSVRSPEQYYQTCSPSSSHSPARSVGRSPSYSSTPSPLMTNPESFQYGQPPMTPGAASSNSSSSAGLQEQANNNSMLMPPRSHPSPNMQHVAPHSYTTTPQVPTMKERFSEKLLSNPSLWSLNALTSQVENISNNVQQLLLSEALVANKKGNKRNSGSSNSSVGSGTSSKKGEEYKSPPYPDSSGNTVGSGPMQDPYSTPQHQTMPMELHEGGYSSSSDEQLDRGYFFCGQGRSPAQASNNIQLNLDTASSCSLTSPDDMSTRSGDSGLHNLTPDASRCQSGLVGDGMSTPVKSIGDDKSPTSMTIPSPLKQERDSPSDIQHINESIKENFEESAWREKSADKEEVTTDKNTDCEIDLDTTKSTEALEKWPDEEKYPSFYGRVNKGLTEKGFCYKEAMYQEFHSKYDPDAGDSVEQSPAALSDASHKENFGQDIKSEAFKSESPTASESSVKTLPFISRGDLEQDQYSTEKEDNLDNTSPIQVEALLERDSEKTQSNCEKAGEDRVEEEGEADDEDDEMQEKKQDPLSPPSSAEVREELFEEDGISHSLTDEHINDRKRAGLEETPTETFSGTESPSPELHSDDVSAGTTDNFIATVASSDVSARDTAIGDIAPQPQSAMSVFSALNDKATPPAPARDHIDHSDTKMLEPDSPQLPGKSILPSAPSWADTPPSPKKGDEDMEPGISCASAVTPLAKPEPVAPSPQPRAFGRKHARGRRRIMNSGVDMRQQLSLEQEGAKEEEGSPLLTQKDCMPPSQTMLFSDQVDLAHPESIVSQTPKMMAVDSFRSRMCTRSFNAPDLPPKVEPQVKRKPGPKPGSKTGIKPGPKPGVKPGPKPGAKPGPKPSVKPGPKSGSKPGPKPAPTPVSNEPELPQIETPVKRKPGPKPGSKPGPKPGTKAGIKPGTKPALKPGPKPKSGSKPVDVLPSAETSHIKASVGRPKGSITKAKLVQHEETLPLLTGLQGRSRKSPKTVETQENQDGKPVDQQEKTLNDEVKAPEENKNMVLRSRKPSQDKISKEKEKAIGIDCEVYPGVQDPDADEQNTISKTVKNPDGLADPTIPFPSVVPLEQSEENNLLPIKRRQSPEPSATPAKKKRGPKPKAKSLAAQPSLQDVVLSTPKEKSVSTSKRKRGPPMKAPVVTSTSKDTVPCISEIDFASDLPAVTPQCPTKTKVLPPRKGRGQKYEAMVQKITSPSSKKHLSISQLDSGLCDEATTKTLSQHVLREGEIPMLINSSETIESESTNAESRQEGIKVQKEEEVAQEIVMIEAAQKLPALEESTQEFKESKDEDIKHGTREDEVTVWSSTEGPGEVKTEGELTQQVSEGLPLDTDKSTKTKRKRWAMVESTDPSAVILETGSLIVTTPRLAKQRAIKNNHEMHLKQRRKKRKGQGSLEETDIDLTEKLEDVEEKVAITDFAVPLADSQDETSEATKIKSTDLIQKPRRGRKPAANTNKRNQGKVASETIAGKPTKVHKKPGPKPGMKDAIEVIEAVIRAAGCEGSKKEESKVEKKEKQTTRVVGPVVTISEKRTETISVKRIRRKVVHQNSKLSFCPYVRINNSRDFSSWCAIVNKPEDAVVFQRRRKKGILRMRNPFTVAKGVPHTAAMQQGPLVNKDLADRCLTCSLCGKPANFRDLGDLCGPYYTNDSIPRKILTIGHTTPLRTDSQQTSEGNCSKSDGGGHHSKDEGDASIKSESSGETSAQETTGTRHHLWRHRRTERMEKTERCCSPRRLTLRERFRRMQQLQSSSTGSSSEQEGSGSVFQRLQEEAEAKEYWTHENCAIWTKGIVMVAGRLYGLKEAASKSAQMVRWQIFMELKSNYWEK